MTSYKFIPSPSEIVIAAISACLQVEDLRGVSFPEAVEAWMRCLAREQERIAYEALS